MLALIKVEQVLTAKIAARAHQWDNSGYWAGDGSRSATHRLARECGLSPGSTRRILHRGHAVTEMNATRTAWQAGNLTADHLDLLARANTPKRAELFRRDEQRLIDCCTSLRYSQAQRAIQRWTQLADAEVDPDGTPPMPETFATTSVTFQGAVTVDAVLDPVGGEMFREQLWRIETELYRTDLAAGTERPAAERRAAALVEMAVRAGTAPANGQRPEPLICAVVGEDSMATMCESLAGTLLSPGLVAPYLSRSNLQAFLYDGIESITGVSNARRFTGRLRRAIQVRDRHCTHPSGCDVPATRCDNDHIVLSSQGGETSSVNGRCLCARHNLNPALRDRSPTRTAEDFREEQLEFAALPPPETHWSSAALHR